MPAWLLLVIELLCVASVIAGVAMIYPPAAFIIGGALAAVACEFTEAKQRRDEAVARAVERARR